MPQQSTPSRRPRGKDLKPRKRRTHLPGTTTESRFWAKVDRKGSGCWEWQAGRHGSGYGETWFHDGPANTHRVAWELTYGPIPDGMWVLHRCDNRLCCRPDHLFLGTTHENIADMVAKERNSRGERQHLAKLTEDDVRFIRSNYPAFSCYQLGQMFGVDPTTVSEAVRRKTWKHVE